MIGVEKEIIEKWGKDERMEWGSEELRREMKGRSVGKKGKKGRKELLIRIWKRWRVEIGEDKEFGRDWFIYIRDKWKLKGGEIGLKWIKKKERRWMINSKGIKLIKGKKRIGGGYLLKIIGLDIEKNIGGNGEIINVRKDCSWKRKWNFEKKKGMRRCRWNVRIEKLSI